MSERNWQKIYTTVFCKLDSDSPSEAEAALHQLRQIHQTQGVAFRNIIDRLQQAVDPEEISRLKEQIAALETTNRTIGRQNEEVIRENKVLRARYSVFAAFGRAAGIITRPLRVLRHESAKDLISFHWQKFVLPPVMPILYFGDFSYLYSSFLFAGASTLAGVVIKSIQCEITSYPEDRLHCKSGWRLLIGGIGLIVAGFGVLIADDWNVQDDKAQIMMKEKDLGPRTFRQPYGVTRETSVETLVGRPFDYSLTVNGVNQPSQTFHCTVYWRAQADVKNELLATTPAPQPDTAQAPHATFGTCDGLSLIRLNFGDK